MSMSVSAQASAAQASATTPSGTTPVSAPWTTCRSTEETTAWVSPEDSWIVYTLFLFVWLCLVNTQTWGRATATGTSTQTTGRVMESSHLTWPKKCAVARTTSDERGINLVSSALFPALVRTRHSHICRISTQTKYTANIVFHICPFRWFFHAVWQRQTWILHWHHYWTRRW